MYGMWQRVFNNTVINLSGCSHIFAAMKTCGPFTLGNHTVVAHDNRSVGLPICIISSSTKFIKYRRRDAFHDRRARRIHRGKVVRTGNFCKVKVGRNQFVRIEGAASSPA